MVTVFLSHSSNDKPFVRELADALESGGEIKVWLDEREIDYGENAVLKMEEGLDADVVLLILSPDSVDSNWVKEEWTDAYWDQVSSQRTKLGPVLYRDCRTPHFLRNKKPFDLRTNQPEGFRQIKTWLLGLRPAPPPVMHLPQRPPLFIGREQEIEDLRSRLKEPGSITYISGLAGRGKTTLALEYAYQYQRDFESVHWLPCHGRSLVQIAGELTIQLGLKLEGDVDTIVRELNGHSARKRCLLILDNVEDDAPAQLLPGGRTSVLITTRLTDLTFLDFHKPIQLPLFTEAQCFELFGDVIGREEVEKHTDEARALFRRVEYLPIAIAVAAKLIRKDVRYTIAGMAKNLPADATALLREAVSALSQPARTLLTGMAVCAPEGFRIALAAEIAGLNETSSLDALQEIYSRSLVEELDRDNRRYRLHALVREASEATDALRRKHAKSIATQFEDWENSWREREKDMPDWQIAFQWSLAQDGDEGSWSTADDLAYTGFRLIQRLGRLPEAYEICERMATEASRRADAARLQTWYGNQAIILKAWGRLEEAMALRQKEERIAVELRDPAGLSRCYGNQALILQLWGRLDEAMGLHEKQRAIYTAIGDQAGLSRCYGNLAALLLRCGRLDEALRFLKDQEDICTKLGDWHGLQGSYGNQVVILLNENRLDEALLLLEKQEVICLAMGDRSSLASCYMNWGAVLRYRSAPQAAREKLEQALALFTELRMPREINQIQDALNETKGNPPDD